MNKKALAALFIVLAVVVFTGCGQSAPAPQKQPTVSDDATKAPNTPVNVVDAPKSDAKPAADPAAKPVADAKSEADAPAIPAVEEKDEPLPEVIAKVGDENITGKDFETKLETVTKMGKAHGMMSAPTLDQKRQILQSMIREKAVLAYAKNQNITVSDEEAQKEIDNVKAKTSPEDFNKRLEEQGISPEELPVIVKQSLLVKKLIEIKTKDLAVSDDEVNAEYDRKKSSGRADRKDETTDVAHILVKVDEGADEAAWNAAREKIDAARKRIVGGEKFADVAKEVTDDPGSKEKGGAYLEVSKGKMVPEFDEKMASTPVGEISEPFKTKYGWHILTVTAKHAPGPRSLDEMKDEIKDTVMRTKRSQTLMQLMQEAESNVKSEVLYDKLAMPAKPPVTTTAPVTVAPAQAAPAQAAPAQAAPAQAAPAQAAPAQAAPAAQPAPEAAPAAPAEGDKK
jgi:parvulin-like peptidyl-prolyl isomerase